MSSHPKEEFYSYSTMFTIKSEKDLDDFWSYFIFRLHLEASTYDRFARLYNLLSSHAKEFSSTRYVIITLKESNKTYNISIETSIETIISNFVQRLKKLKFAYTYEEGVLRYSIDKEQTKKPSAKEKKKSAPTHYEAYDFIRQDDLREMQACIDKVRDGNYNKIYVNEISDYQHELYHYAGFLQLYPQLNSMNSIVGELAMILSFYNDACETLGFDFKKLIQSFVNNLGYWQERLFVTGGEELHFMDESFKADLSQIKVGLNLYDEPLDAQEESLDDIFSF